MKQPLSKTAEVRYSWWYPECIEAAWLEGEVALALLLFACGCKAGFSLAYAVSTSAACLPPVSGSEMVSLARQLLASFLSWSAQHEYTSRGCRNWGKAEKGLWILESGVARYALPGVMDGTGI